MGRRSRKIARNNRENVPPPPPKNVPKEPTNKKLSSIILSAQDSVAHHDKLIRELQTVYSQCRHSDFLEDFLLALRNIMIKDRANEYANKMLQFCAKFVAMYNNEDTHPLVTGVFSWFLSTLSPDKNVRLRMCEFINLLLKSLGEEAALDDSICDGILKYMTHAMNDANNLVREQAVLALQRLQMPDDPNDTVVKLFLFHMNTDTSPRVRQAIITSIGRNINTIPQIIERLWDVDEKVRRHVILEMSRIPVRSLKVANRLTLLERGLNDHSESVQKTTASVLLPCWQSGYNDDFIALVEGLKLDTNDKEMQRYRKCTLQALQHIFKKSSMEKIVTTLGFAAPEKRRGSDDDEDDLEVESPTNNAFPKCVPLTALNNDVAVYWEAAVVHLQDMDELNAIQPELTIFCQYVEKFCDSIHFEPDKWQQMKNQHTLLSLLQIVAMYDLGDEVGRDNLKKLLRSLLTKYDLNEMNISVIVRIMEQIYPVAEDRLQVMVEIIQEILQFGDANVTTIDSEMESTLLRAADIELQLKVSALKVKMMDLKEQENSCVQRKDYASAQKATEEWTQCNEEYVQLLQPLLTTVDTGASSSTVQSRSILKPPQKITTETIQKCMQIIYYTICSEHTKSITPGVVSLYSQFISRHMDSQQVALRDWAFKCAITCSILYSMMAKEVAQKLCEQFSKNTNIRIWTTAIEGLFELVDRYGLDMFMDAPSEDEGSSANKSTGRMAKSRQLYSNTTGQDSDRDVPQNIIEVIGQLSHLLENCEHGSIVQALIVGFCRFVLHGHYTESNIVMKFILYFFNPATEPEINQILGIFFETLTKEKKQEYLQPALLPALFVIFEAPIDSPLQEIKPTAVMDFVIDVTKPEYCSAGLNIHNTIGMSFMNAMQDNVTHKEVLKVLSKGLLSLEISDDPTFRQDLKKCCDDLLKVIGLDEKVMKNITHFKDILDGVQRSSLTFSSTRVTSNVQEKDSNDEEADEEAEVEGEAKLDTINESTEGDNSILAEKTDATIRSAEEVLVPATPSPQRSQPPTQDSFSIPETQKTSQESSDVSVVEASLDETASSQKRVARKTTRKPSPQPSTSMGTRSSSAKRLPESRTPVTRAKLKKVDSATASKAAVPPRVAKKQVVKPVKPPEKKTPRVDQADVVGSPSRRAKDPNYRARYLEEKGTKLHLVDQYVQ
ncbi:Condensin complex subunit 3 [Sergentomyia squamirostris]